MLSFHLSLVGESMSGYREATSDCSLVRLDADDDKVRPSGHDPLTEYLTGFQERELSAHFLKGVEKEGEGEEDEGGEEGGEEKGRGEEVEAFSSLNDDYRPFILPKIWSVNDFLSKMSDEVLGRLCPRFRIPNDIPLMMAGKAKSAIHEGLQTLALTNSSLL